MGVLAGLGSLGLAAWRRRKVQAIESAFREIR